LPLEAFTDRVHNEGL
jgi:transcription antitermination factor NusG